MNLLFVDPASRSTGHCLMQDGQITQHSTIAAQKNLKSWERIGDIGFGYWQLAHDLKVRGINIDFCHIERMNYRVHFMVQWSIGAIVSNLAAWGIPSDADISPMAWQKTVDWKGLRAPLQAYKDLVTSEDELASIGMAIHWKETNNV